MSYEILSRGWNLEWQFLLHDIVREFTVDIVIYPDIFTAGLDI